MNIWFMPFFQKRPFESHYLWFRCRSHVSMQHLTPMCTATWHAYEIQAPCVCACGLESVWWAGTDVTHIAFHSWEKNIARFVLRKCYVDIFQTEHCLSFYFLFSLFNKYTILEASIQHTPFAATHFLACIAQIEPDEVGKILKVLPKCLDGPFSCPHECCVCVQVYGCCMWMEAETWLRWPYGMVFEHITFLIFWANLWEWAVYLQSSLYECNINP